MSEQERGDGAAARGDVQTLDRMSMIVYEAVATMDYEGQAAKLSRLVSTTGLHEADVRSALNQLITEGHVCAGPSGYFLDSHDGAP
jgi:hypothetical protein